MERNKMINMLTSLVNDAWWIGYKGRATKTGIRTMKRRCNQISKALGNGKLSPEELKNILVYAGVN